MILVATALFPPEPVVSANLSYDIALELSSENDVVVVSPNPTRPYGMKFDQKSNQKYPFCHVVLDSYICPEPSVFGRFRESYSFGKHLRRYIEDNHKKISLIYANIWPLFAQKHLAEVASKFKIPFILHVQDVYPESLSKKVKIFGALIDKAFLPMDRKNQRAASQVVTISNQMKNYLTQTRYVDESKISVIRNWQNDSSFIRFQRNDGLHKNVKFCFLYLGTVNPTASVDLLIHAFGKSDLTDACLIIAGDGADKQRCVQIAEGYACDIQFMNVSPDEVPEVQSRADVLLLPLKKGIAGTALPSKMTAYMFSGKPILASIDRDSEAANIIEKNTCGWVVEPENEQQLIDSMIRALTTDDSFLKKMGKNSLEYAITHLSKKSNLRRLISIIEEAKRSQVQC